jgi:hypothetical protein
MESDNTKTAAPTNSVTRIPLLSDINNRRFLTAVLSGVLGGAGVASAANLLRSFREMRKPKQDETDDETIVLTLPSKAAADGYAGMQAAKPGEKKVVSTGKGGVQQMRDGGRFGKGIGKGKEAKPEVKCADGNPGPNSTGTIVANAIGLTAGGLLSYDVVSRLYDALQERRLKRKLEAAQQAYVNAMSGASKRAEIVTSVLAPVAHAFCKEPMDKTAGILDILPGDSANVIRYPAAAYILALLAGTGATAYVTKKVMDKQFPEEKIKKDINRPTRIVFRTEGAKPALVEGAEGEEKAASAETCAALTALLPIYMDVVEGAPSRTLAEPYVKMAAAAGTDPAGLLKIAKADLSQAYGIVLRDPKALWAILKGTKFGLNFSKLNAAHALRDARPDTYRRAVDAAIDSTLAGGPNDGIIRRAWNGVARAGTKAFAALGGRDMLVDRALKSAAVEDLVVDAFKPEEEQGPAAPVDVKAVSERVKARLRRRRGIAVEAADPRAARYLRVNKAVIRQLLAKLNAQGSI